MSFLTSRRLFSTLSFAVLASLIAPSITIAHGVQVGDIEIKHPYARPTLAGQVNGGVFFNGMFNKGKTSDYLISAKVDESIAKSTELHRMSMEGDVMKMRALAAGLDLPAGKPVEFKPGGYHVMLMDLKLPLQKDTTIPLTLTFKDAKGVETKKELKVPVSQTAPAGAAAGGGVMFAMT